MTIYNVSQICCDGAFDIARTMLKLEQVATAQVATTNISIIYFT